MKIILLALVAITLGCNQEPPPPPKQEVISIAVPQELFQWTQNLSSSFGHTLDDGSILSPQVETLTWLQALREIPTGIKKPDLWISPHPILLEAANRRVKSLGVSFDQCTPLFESKLMIVGHKKDIAALESSEAVSNILLKDSTFIIPDPKLSTVGFLASIEDKSNLISYPPALLPLSLIHDGTYIIAPEYVGRRNMLPVGFESTISTKPALSYQLCLSQGGLRRQAQLIGAKELYQHIKSNFSTLDPPAGFTRINEPSSYTIATDTIEALINTPASNLEKISKTILFDNSGSIAEKGFGDAQRVALGFINDSSEGDSLAIKAISGSNLLFSLENSKKQEGIEFIQGLKPQGVGTFKEALKNELISASNSNHYSQLIIITDGETVESNNNILSWLEPISKNKFVQVIFFFTSDSPLLHVIRDFNIPGVLTVAPEEIPIWINYLNP